MDRVRVRNRRYGRQLSPRLPVFRRRRGGLGSDATPKLRGDPRRSATLFALTLSITMTRPAVLNVCGATRGNHMSCHMHVRCQTSPVEVQIGADSLPGRRVDGHPSERDRIFTI